MDFANGRALKNSSTIPPVIFKFSSIMLLTSSSNNNNKIKMEKYISKINKGKMNILHWDLFFIVFVSLVTYHQYHNFLEHPWDIVGFEQVE